MCVSVYVGICLSVCVYVCVSAVRGAQGPR